MIAFDPSDRRRFPRADLVFRVKYRSIKSVTPINDEDEELDQLQTETGRDISLGGVSFEATNPPESGEVLHLSFYFDELPGEIAAIGRVVRSWNAPGAILTAVKFTVIDPDDCNILSTYIEQYEKSK
ncbi:MAG: PilZ domain-containing protein [Leptonema sp. (in: Bacteria)]|nr:PilZ domain-containing protein [Leptonema sp. (in: bacteria)]